MAKDKTMIGFKGFDKDWQCRGTQYMVGEMLAHKGSIKLCDSGLHFVENPLDAFNYYPPADSHFAEVEADGVSEETHPDDSKRVAKKLTIKAELSLHNLVDAAVKFTLSKVDFENAKESNTGDRSASTNTGDRSASTNTGYQSASTNTGTEGTASIQENKEGVAMSVGIDGKAKAPKGSWLVLAEWEKDKDSEWHRKSVKTAEVDGKAIQADVFYTLKAGKFVEAEDQE